MARHSIAASSTATTWTIVRTAELGGVNFHSLRHTAASLWIRAGIDIFTVSRRLGHTKTSFTMDVYAHLLEGQQAAAASALDHLLVMEN